MLVLRRAVRPVRWQRCVRCYRCCCSCRCGISAAARCGACMGLSMHPRESSSFAALHSCPFSAFPFPAAAAETARKQVAEGGGLNLVLDAIQRFPWDGAVQTKGYWLLAIMSADARYATELGGQGAVEMVIAGMRACEEDYQVSGACSRAICHLPAATCAATHPLRALLSHRLLPLPAPCLALYCSCRSRPAACAACRT